MKRKRAVEEENEAESLHISSKLHFAVRLSRKVAKKVKTFETQKLVKKLRELRRKEDKPDEIKHLEAELAVIKHINHKQIAKVALAAKLKKDRTLLANQDIAFFIQLILESNSQQNKALDTTTSKIRSRMLSSKALATEISSIVLNLETALRRHASDHRAADSPPFGKSSTPGNDKVTSTKANRRQALTESDGASDGPRDLAPDSASEIEQEGEDEDSSSPSSIYPLTASEHPFSPRTVGQKLPAVGTLSVGQIRGFAAPVQSTFLPSLAIGYTRGDSEASDWSDTEANITDIRPHKNRRGQRARRAIWEKKYGTNANHVKNKQSAEQLGKRRTHLDSPGADKTSKHASSSQFRERPEPKAPPLRSKRTEAFPRRLGKTTALPQNAPQTERRPLHPSWEAKKKLKEKQSVGIIAAQGKKIRFD